MPTTTSSSFHSNSGLPLSSRLAWWHTGLPLPSPPKPSSWWRSWLSACSAFRSTTPRLGFWRLSWRGVLLGAMLIYLGLWMTAEFVAAGGWVNVPHLHVNMSRLRLSADIFPLDHHLRGARAQAVIVLSMMGYALEPNAVIAEIDAVLADDPYAADLKADRELIVRNTHRSYPAIP